MSSKHSFNRLTTLRVGGGVRDVVRPKTIKECVELIAKLDANKTPLLVLGGGSNILAPDDPFAGTVIIPFFSSVSFENCDSFERVVSDAGVVWDNLVAQAVEKNLWGLENLSAIPGNVGAAPIQNIGAYGTDLSKTLEWVEVYDRKEQTIKKLDNAKLNFTYRTSLLKKERGRYIVLRVSLVLSKEPQPNFSYKDLKQRLNSQESPSLNEIRNAVIEIRKEKFPNLREYGTAGSFFLNPILPEDEAKEFLRKYPDAPNYKDVNGVKFSLAWILDSVIGAKGMRVGGAFVWDQQPLVIVTEDGATSKDVRELMQKIKEKVFEKTKIKIIPEVFVM